MQADGGGWETINLTLTAGPLRNCIEAATPGICVCVCVCVCVKEICGVIVCNKCLCHDVKNLFDVCHWCTVCVCVCVCVRGLEELMPLVSKLPVLDLRVWVTGCCPQGGSSTGQASVKPGHHTRTGRTGLLPVLTSTQRVFCTFSIKMMLKRKAITESSFLP